MNRSAPRLRQADLSPAKLGFWITDQDEALNTKVLANNYVREAARETAAFIETLVEESGVILNEASLSLAVRGIRQGDFRHVVNLLDIATNAVHRQLILEILQRTNPTEREVFLAWVNDRTRSKEPKDKEQE